MTQYFWFRRKLDKEYKVRYVVYSCWVPGIMLPGLQQVYLFCWIKEIWNKLDPWSLHSLLSAHCIDLFGSASTFIHLYIISTFSWNSLLPKPVQGQWGGHYAPVWWAAASALIWCSFGNNPSSLIPPMFFHVHPRACSTYTCSFILPLLRETA